MYDPPKVDQISWELGEQGVFSGDRKEISEFSSFA
jgi:hypothetical protein